MTLEPKVILYTMEVSKEELILIREGLLLLLDCDDTTGEEADTVVFMRDKMGGVTT